MPSWSEILTEVDSYSNVGVELDKKRKEFFDKIHDITGRNVIAYYSGSLMHRMSALMTKIKMRL